MQMYVVQLMLAQGVFSVADGLRMDSVEQFEETDSQKIAADVEPIPFDIPADIGSLRDTLHLPDSSPQRHVGSLQSPKSSPLRLCRNHSLSMGLSPQPIISLSGVFREHRVLSDSTSRQNTLWQPASAVPGMLQKSPKRKRGSDEHVPNKSSKTNPLDELAKSVQELDREILQLQKQPVVSAEAEAGQLLQLKKQIQFAGGGKRSKKHGKTCANSGCSNHTRTGHLFSRGVSDRGHPLCDTCAELRCRALRRRINKINKKLAALENLKN